MRLLNVSNRLPSRRGGYGDMPMNLERFKADLAKLLKLGEEMSLDLMYQIAESERALSEAAANQAAAVEGCFEDNYQSWYTEACAVLRQLLPDRLQEFNELYQGDGKRKEIDATNYNIQDWLHGVDASRSYGVKIYNELKPTSKRFQTQVGILRSAEGRFESSLFDIVQLVRADLFDSELEAARELTKHGFLRGAGAIAGVVIERHLAQVCNIHKISIQKKNPNISDFNDRLKDGAVLDVPTWRQIQRLADIRNLCDHNKEREPTADEVMELVAGVDKVCKTIF